MALIDTSEKDNPLNYLEARITALVNRVKELEKENTFLVQRTRTLEAELIASGVNTELL